MYIYPVFLLALIILVLISTYDVRDRRISNFFNSLLFSILFVYSLLTPQDQSVGIFILLCAVNVLIAIVLFYTSIIGGGDAKMIIAASPIISAHSYIGFLLVTVFSGALLALAILILRYCVGGHGRILTVPYGIALSLGVIQLMAARL